MSKLYDSVGYDNLNFKYEGPTKDVSFYEYMNSKDLFDAIRSSKIKLSDALHEQNEFLNKLNDVKIGKKNLQQKEVTDNLENFYKSREETINFLETILKCYQMQITMLKKMRLREKDLKY